MEKIEVIFMGGETRIGNSGCNYMLATVETEDDEIELYAEFGESEEYYDENGEFDMNRFDDDSYEYLKTEITRQAIENGINPERLVF